MELYLVFAGVVIHLASTAAYIWSTLQGRTKPNRMTFLLWGVVPMIAVAAAFSEGVRWALVPVFISGLGPLLVFFASFVNPNAYWKLGRFDYFCGAFSIFAIILWMLTSDALLAIVFAIIADTFAAWPTIVKAWQFPETENFWPFVGSTLNQFIAFYVAPSLTFAVIAFPIYLIVCNTLILMGIGRKYLSSLLYSRA